jgi:curli biogenesis system outer membrane secretion channel CsgG
MAMRTARTRILLTVFIAALAVGPPATAQPAGRPTIAIIDFEASPSGWTLPPPRLGEIVATLMLDRLVAAGPYHVLDGQWLQHGNRSPMAVDRLRGDAEAAGVDYLILGSITRFSAERKQRSLGAAAFVVPVLGGFRRQKNELVVAITARIVDVRTGEVVATATGQGSAIRTKLALGGLGLVRAGGAGGLSNGSLSPTEFRDAQLDEAIQRSVAAAADGLVHAAPRLTHVKPESR